MSKNNFLTRFIAKLLKKKAKHLSVLLTCALLFASGQAIYASEQSKENRPQKDEIIYAKLKDDGRIQNLYTVNRFTTEQNMTYEDFGTYKSTQALSSFDMKPRSADSLQLDLPSGVHFYQGENSNLSLPWEYSFTYELNGKAITPAELRNKSGILHIYFTVKKNRADINYNHFHQAFLQQLTITLKGEELKLFHAPKAVIALTGSNYVLQYQVLPNKDLSGEILAEAKSWQPEAIQIAALPFQLSLDLDLPNPQEIAREFSPLHDGLSQLAYGLNRLNQGFSQGLLGFKEFLNGMDALDKNSQQIANGLQKLYTGADELHNGSTQFGTGLNQADEGAAKLSSGLHQLNTGLQKALPLQQLKLAEEAITKLLSFLQELKSLTNDNLQTANLAQMQIKLQELQNTLQKLDVLNKSIFQTKTALLTEREMIAGTREKLHDLNIENEAAFDRFDQQITNLEIKNEDLKIYLQSHTPASEEEKLIIDRLQSYLQDEKEVFTTWSTLKQAWQICQNKLRNFKVELDTQLHQLASQNEETIHAIDRLTSEDTWQKLLSLPGELKNSLSLLTKLLSLLPQHPPETSTDSDLSKLLEKLTTARQLLQEIPKLSAAVEALDAGLEKLSAGLGELNSNYPKLSGGIYSLRYGIGQLHSGFLQYQDGVGQATAGAHRLHTGFWEMNKGSLKLQGGLDLAANQTSPEILGKNIEEKMSTFTTDFLPKEYKPESFLSPKNKAIRSVQFVILTANEENKNTLEKPSEEVKLSLWEKFLNLFRRVKKAN